MVTWLLVVAVVTLFLFVVSMLFMRLERHPYYRMSREQMIRLFERVLAGDASEIEWRTFLSIPQRHDEFFEELRRHCEQLDEQFGRNVRGRLLTRQGREELAQLLDELHQYDHKEF